MNYFEDEKYLINMVSAEDIIRFGYAIGLNETSRVLDLCCGYGTMLKLWNEIFGISGVGVDRVEGFIETGRSRLQNERINLICGDVLQYVDIEKYDVVVCTELSAGLFYSFAEGITFLEKFLKPGGVIVFGRLFSEIPNPPQELIDFDGPMPTLSEIYDEAKQCGYLIISMASGSNASWERYIMRGKRTSDMTWNDKWHRIYYDYRRPYGGWALFGIEKL
ncbi:MAG: class I SAM-dependent methyltransferase [Oscillospiraceae bacterium]|nr:class I SAM-dependent methyltransferase [Oscillospiraceae bacterium]